MAPLRALSLCTLLAASWTSGALAQEPAVPPAAPAATTPSAAESSGMQIPPEAEQPVHTQKAAPRAAPATFASQEAQVDAARRRQAQAVRSGKSDLARRLSALATRWLAVIDALRTAARLETEADALEDERLEILEQTDRLVTLVEQTQARRARALARLQELGLEPSGLPAASPTPSPGSER